MRVRREEDVWGLSQWSILRRMGEWGGRGQKQRAERERAEDGECERKRRSDREIRVRGVCLFVVETGTKKEGLRTGTGTVLEGAISAVASEGRSAALCVWSAYYLLSGHITGVLQRD